MTERVTFGVPVEALQGAPGSGDRFVYSYRYAALSNTGGNGRPVLTRAQWVYLAKAAGLTGEATAEWLEWHGGQAKGVEAPAAPAAEGEATMRMRLAHGVPGVDPAEQALPSKSLARLAETLRAGTRLTSTAPGGGTGSTGGGMSTHMPPKGNPGTTGTGTVLDRTPEQVLLDLARSEIGLLFLDRTRLRPAGFVVGEHLHTMGLAPGEEVVLEQRSFVQRDTLNEAASETEGSTEGETASSTTIDHAEVIAGSITRTRTDGFSAGGTVGFEYGVKAAVNGGVSESTTDADNDTRTDSVKEVAARTTKNVAKMRDLHKTVFRVSESDRFERAARRTIRNPNQFTPIDLHFYKVLQRIRFSHERYGVRLCWTPFVRDPAGDFYAAETAMKEKLLKAARDSVPAVVLPPQPNVGEVPGARLVGLDPPMTELTQWGGWPGSDMSADYTLPINVPSGMKWDGDIQTLQGSLRSTLTGAPRGFGVHTVGDPWEVVNSAGDRTIFQIIHCGAGWRLAGSSQIWVSLSARVIPDTSSLSQAQASATAAWEAQCATLIAQRAAKVADAEAVALAEFEAWRIAHRASLNPAQELMRRFINAMFPADARDEIAELDVWEQVFDWELAAARTYSGTWNGDGSLRDPARPAGDFVNASWARLFLPVRTGYEDIALRWIFLRSQQGTGPAGIEGLVRKVLKELTDWRSTHLGGPQEVELVPGGGSCPEVVQKHVCLGTWTEDVPTDGVHTEVTLAGTTAADLFTEAVALGEKDRTAAASAALLAQSKVSEAVAGGDLATMDVAVHLSEPRP
ncbi:hypothetical protein ACFQY4_26905 [Catellatospora bangladeshensis]|uniref:Uncharacterized protein n=1 Tax=Catellatospora bangladeshensis TaxID=310355 RepID=A0A8J3JL53_9ACTN|nr:hypothetical protein [Catellatospora bangladeshensis]GIF82628.1 hypothetical protein Cba03nite_39770 [Catellatospora bangladeshensis]